MLCMFTLLCMLLCSGHFNKRFTLTYVIYLHLLSQLVISSWNQGISLLSSQHVIYIVYLPCNTSNLLRKSTSKCFTCWKTFTNKYV